MSKNSSIIVKTPEADLRAKSGFIMDLSLMGALLIVILSFASSGGGYEEIIVNDKDDDNDTEVINIPPTEQVTKPPPPSRPQIPIEAEDEDEVDEVTIDDTDVDITEEYTDIEEPEDDEPLEFFAVSEKPRILKKGKIRYPPLAQKAGIEARVTIEFIIDEQGNPQSVKVLKGHPMLNDAALAAARQYKFSPARQGDKPVKVKWRLPFRFRLNN